MMRSSLLSLLVASLFLPVKTSLGADEDVRLNGIWTLNRSLSEFPRELGFSPEWLGAGGPPSSTSGGDASQGGRGGRGSRGGGGSTGGASGGFAPVRESADDAARVRLLTGEVKSPPSRLTIVDTAAAVTITDDGGSRTFHPTGREEALATTTMGLPDIIVATRREGDRLVVTYNVEEGRQLRYTYSTLANPRQLVVDVEFVERRGGDKVHRVYDRGTANETAAPAPVGASASPATPPGLRGPGLPGGPPKPEPFDQRPDAGLRGLTTLGFVVEELSPQAAACGLKHDALDAALSKRLADAGFTVKRQSDDDTYVYVNINTTSATISPGSSLCVSRYDAFLYTHTTAKLAHTTMPVLVQVSLLHDGGIAGGSPAAHAAGVEKGLEGMLDQFASRIHDAGK